MMVMMMVIQTQPSLIQTPLIRTTQIRSLSREDDSDSVSDTGSSDGEEYDASYLSAMG